MVKACLTRVLPAVSEFEVKAYSEKGFVLFHGLRDGHFDFVAQELSLLVAGLDLF